MLDRPSVTVRGAVVREVDQGMVQHALRQCARAHRRWEVGASDKGVSNLHPQLQVPADRGPWVAAEIANILDDRLKIRVTVDEAEALDHPETALVVPLTHKGIPCRIRFLEHVVPSIEGDWHQPVAPQLRHDGGA